jgi:hypothetical protein
VGIQRGPAHRRLSWTKLRSGRSKELDQEGWHTICNKMCKQTFMKTKQNLFSASARFQFNCLFFIPKNRHDNLCRTHLCVLKVNFCKCVGGGGEDRGLLVRSECIRKDIKLQNQSRLSMVSFGLRINVELLSNFHVALHARTRSSRPYQNFVMRLPFTHKTQPKFRNPFIVGCCTSQYFTPFTFQISTLSPA